jgi:hypothetical protein
MCDINVGDMVQLIHGLPTLWLSCGEVGVVKSLWLSPRLAYEVEFYPTNQRSGVRTLLFADELEAIKLAGVELMRPGG